MTHASSASTSPTPTLLGADAHGKHLLIRFDDGRTLYAHLRIDGSFVVGPAADAFRSGGGASSCGWRTAGSPVSTFRSSASSPRPTKAASSVTSVPTCADPISPTSMQSSPAWSNDPDEPLGGALLDQRNVAGFGNVYAVELPFIVGVSPDQPIGTVDGLRGLLALGAAVIRTNAERGPQNTTGRRLHAADHWIYARRGRPCPLCGTVLDGRDERESAWGRVTVWCPQCQPLEPRRTVDLDRARRLLALHPARRQPMYPSA